MLCTTNRGAWSRIVHGGPEGMDAMLAQKGVLGGGVRWMPWALVGLKELQHTG